MKISATKKKTKVEKNPSHTQKGRAILLSTFFEFTTYLGNFNNIPIELRNAVLRVEF